MENTEHRPARDEQTRRRLITLLTMVGALVTLLIIVHQKAGPDLPPTQPVVREFAIFDSYARITLWTDRDTAEGALAACAGDMRAIHDTINNYDEESELSALNRTAATAPFVCSDLLWDVLQAAREGYEISEGAFDVSVGPLMALWGFHQKRDGLPTDEEIAAALETVGLDRVQFDDRARSVRFSVPGMSLDLGGIAKGYALDRVMDILRRHHVSRALVDLGGNIACTDLPPPQREAFYVGIRDPFDTGAMLGRIRVLGRSLATSGNYERRLVIQGRTIGHIIDPRTGHPVKGPAGVTAITTSGRNSDVFSTAVFVGGAPMAQRLCNAVPDTGFVLISGLPDAPVRTIVGDAGVVIDE